MDRPVYIEIAYKLPLLCYRNSNECPVHITSVILYSQRNPRLLQDAGRIEIVLDTIYHVQFLNVTPALKIS